MFSKITALSSALLVATALAAPLPLANLASDIAANVVMTSGASQFAVWIPTDAAIYPSSSLSCLNIGASSMGSCDITSIDQVAVYAGYMCMFVGSNGWTGAQTGTSDSGWLPVSPPQTIIQMACVAV